MAKKEVRAFLDSNVILSGLISEKGPPRIILDILSLDLPFITGVTGRYNIIEIERNLTRKAPQALPIYKRYFSALHLKIIPTPAAKDIKQYSGRIANKDVPVLVSAIKGKADFLVTGDKKDFAKLKGMELYPFTIVTPAEFIDVTLPAILKDC